MASQASDSRVFTLFPDFMQTGLGYGDRESILGLSYPFRDPNVSFVTEKYNEKEILSRLLLTECAKGAEQKQLLVNQLEAQNGTNDILMAQRQDAYSMHVAVQHELARQGLRMEAGVERQINASLVASDRVVAGLGDLAYDFREGFDDVIDAVDNLGATLAVSLSTVVAEMQQSNATLFRIEKALYRPSDTKVNELIARIDELIGQAKVETNRVWKVRTYNDALDVLMAARKEAIGDKSPRVWAQSAFVFWQVGIIMPEGEERFEMLLSASECFENAARLYTRDNAAAFEQNMRHAAHVQYLIGRPGAARELLTDLAYETKVSAAMYEAARYSAKLGDTKTALKLLKTYVKAFPLFAHLMFAESDFAEMRLELFALDEELREELRRELEPQVSALLDYPTKVSGDPSSIVGNFGNATQVAKFMKLCASVGSAPSYFRTCRLRDALLRLVKEMKSTSTSQFELVRNLYVGRRETANAAAVVRAMLAQSAAVLIDLEREPKVWGDLLKTTETDARPHVLMAQTSACEAQKRMRQTVAAVLGNFTKHGIAIEKTDACKAAHVHAEVFGKMTYTELKAHREMADEFSCGAFIPVYSCWLGDYPRAQFPRIAFRFDQSKPAFQVDLAAATLESMLFMLEVQPQLCDDTVREFKAFLDACVEYGKRTKSGIYGLRLQKESKVDTSWVFSYRNAKGGVETVEFDRPHVAEATFFKKAVPFKDGDPIPNSVLLSAYRWKVRATPIGKIIDSATKTFKF